MRTSTCLLPKVLGCAFLGLALSVSQQRLSTAQDVDSVIPASYQGSGGFFNQQLGTALRFNYNTQGYGTQDDVFTLGGMKVFNLDGATVFLDGQGTLSDDFGGGFNFGVGYRQLTTTGANFDPQRILGVGFWTDGQSTASDNFFTQLGFSLESLGDSYDLRLNGHFPLERTQTSDPALTGTGTPFFMGNNIFGATEMVTIDTAHTVVDGEFAKRINDLEAWAFLGGYQLGGGGVDATGYRAGVRGYAVPDLAMSLQVSDDDVYATNVMFGITWFIGRTHKGNQPCGNLLDRFREPVQRNNFIAMTSRQESTASGNALTATGTTDAIRVVHVNSGAGAGGDGTFENPFDQISDIDAANAANSLEGDILFVHSGSAFAGADGVATLQDNQRLLGEGVDQNMNEIPHVVATNELGNINLPESSAGSQTGARPTIDGAGLDVITLVDNNTVNNFTINNAGTAILAAPDDGAMDTLLTPTLQNLQINDAVTGVLLREVSGTALVENTVEINRATTTGLEVDQGQDGMSIAATINDSTGHSLSIHDRLGGTIDFTGTIDDDTALAGNFSDGVSMNLNSDATINLTNALNIRVDDGEFAILATNNAGSTINASGAVDITATGTGNGLLIDGNDVNTTVTFADLGATAFNGDTVSIFDGGTVTLSSDTSTDSTRGIANTGTGRALFNDGNLVDADRNATVTVNSNITNGGGGLAVEIQDRSANDVTVAGTVNVDNADAAGVSIHDNTGGSIILSNTLTLNTGTFDAISLVNNSDGMTDATISFNDLDLDTTTGTAFSATAGGNLIVTSANGTNDINVNGAGTGLVLNDMTIDPANVTFDVVSVTNGAAGIDLQNLDGTGQVIIGGGTNAGDGGTLVTTGTAININNADNVAMTNVTVNNAAAAAGLVVTGQQTGSSTTFTGLDITTVNADAVNINNNDDGTIAFNTLTATTTGNGDGIDLNNADGSNVAININSATVNANGSGMGFTATGGGTILVAGTNEINSTGGNAFNVDDVESLTASNVTINNTTERGVNVVNQDTGTDSVTLNNFDVTTTTAEAVRVADNSAGTVILNGLTAESDTGNTVVVDNNTGSTVSINNMTASATGSGDVFTATNGGTLIATGTNNVTANTGQALNIDGMTIDNANVTFADVDVTNGATTGVNLSNLTGGSVTINGGSVNTSAVGINISNVENASVNNVTATSTGANAIDITHTSATSSDLSFSNVTVTDGLQGVDIAANGAGEFDLTFNNVDISGISGEGIAFDTGANADRVDLTITNSTVTAGDASAFFANLDDSNTADVRFVIDDNTFANASGSAGTDSAALNINLTSGLLLSARIGNLIADQDPPAAPLGDSNRFTNSSVDGDPLRVSVSNGVLNLDLRDNTAQGGTVEYVLTQTGGTFNLVDAVDTVGDANNVGTVNDSGVINTTAPPVLAPTP